MKKRFFFLFSIIITVSCSNPGNRGQHKNNPYPTFKKIEGKVIKISDGDTFTLLLEKDNFPVRVRLIEIDAPERKQPFSKKSKQYLSHLIFGKKVTVYYKKKDRYGRILGHVFLKNNKLNINHEMVKNGYAWQFKKYSNDKKLAELEKEAKLNKRGLWQDKNAVPPWEWRKNKNQNKRQKN